MDPRIFGGLLEHMGRAVYEGVYDPQSSCADESGFRQDVLGALRQLRLTAKRYPGGNFLSGYNWLDGVGPKAQRPRRRELAWQSVETNQFGTNECIEFCAAIDATPMLGVNMGTGDIRSACDLVEYCNVSHGTYWSDLRASDGFHEPHDLRYWCVGNEMDGPWQIGHLDAAAYGNKALEVSVCGRNWSTCFRPNWTIGQAALVRCWALNAPVNQQPNSVGQRRFRHC